MTTSKELTAIVNEWLMLAKETGEFHRDDRVTGVLLEVQRILAGIRRRLDSGSRQYVVAAIGLTNVGKSTLLNALLGEDLAPRRNRPCTAAPIEFIHGEDFLVTVHLDANIHRPSWRCATSEEVHERLAALARDDAVDTARGIRRVVVRAPIPLLRSGLVIADTPGFGAAQAGDAEGSHEAALRRYLSDEVSQVFWIVLADQGIGKREKSFHDQFFSKICDDVVVTGSENWDPHDRQRFRDRFSSLFGDRLPRFHFVSGLQGLRARNAQDAAGLETAGITLLEERIRELAEPKGRYAAIDQTLTQLAKDLGDWLGEFRDSRQQALRPRWRLDSWARWQELLPANPLKQRLTASLEEPKRAE